MDAYIQKNKDDETKYIPNLKGFMVGNGVTDWKYDTTPAFVEMAYWHGLYDDETYMELKKCDLSYYEWNYDKLSETCTDLMDRFDDLTSQLNIYDVFGKCYTNPTTSTFELHGNNDFGFLRQDNGFKTVNTFYTAADYTPFLFKRRNQAKRLREIPPCVYAAPVLEYLNKKDVREALHIHKDAKEWDLCAPVDYTRGKDGSIEIYKQLKGKYRILKFSGDTDGAVPTYGTLQWIRDLAWTVTEEWRPYYIIDEGGNQQVAGYVEAREGNFTFVTVHGAGHMAPQWK